MDPFLALLNSLSACLSASEVSALKFLCQDKIGKRKLESVQSARELFICLMEQQLISRYNVDLLKTMFKSIKREDLILQLEQFIEDGEANAPDEQPDLEERRLQKVVIEVICENVGRDWKMLMRKLNLSEARLEEIEEAKPHNLRERLFWSLRTWQKLKGKDAKFSGLWIRLLCCVKLQKMKFGPLSRRCIEIQWVFYVDDRFTGRDSSAQQPLDAFVMVEEWPCIY
uniref:Fas associated via death domain n=1 Tax=Phasianus colchicus TaxID=9054 RepID=A0A669PFI1_PHACC